jgi:rare lipoprotein A
MVRAPARYRIPLIALVASVLGPGAGCGGSSAVRASPAAVRNGTRAQVGMATFYAARLTGRRTASGERYDPEALTAAHRSLPLGTLVRVTRIDSSGAPLSDAVVVRVNDRGPYGPGRILDLSLAAARRLGMLHAGVVRVRVEVLGPDGVK